jgi:hypothetical protein
MLLTYGSAKTHSQSTSGHRLSQTLKYGYRNSERSQELFKLCVLSYLPDKEDLPTKFQIYRGDTSRDVSLSSGSGSETGRDRMAISSGRLALLKLERSATKVL